MKFCPHMEHTTHHSNDRRMSDVKNVKWQNQIFIIGLFAVAHLSLQRVVGPSPRLSAWAAVKKRRSGGEP